MERTASFGYWLRRRRKALDLTQEALAQQVGCAAITIRKIEADILRPSAQIAERLATCLRLEDAERTSFLKVTRVEVAVDHLPLATTPIALAIAPLTLPSGIVTLLVSDIEGSTQLWERHPDLMRAVLAPYDALMRQAIEACGGLIFKAVGDGIHAVFAHAAGALAAALQAQRTLQAEAWGPIGPIRVRMAISTGEAEARDNQYVGPAPNRAARLLAVGHGGQILVSHLTAELLIDGLPPDIVLRDLGQHRLKDLTRPAHIFQVLAPDLLAALPPLNTLDARPNNLPAQPNALIGREQAIAVVRELLWRTDMRLITLTGSGGIGKTRLALQVASELLDAFAHGVWFVDLAPISDPALLLPAIAQALGIKEAGGRSLLESLKHYLRNRQLLLLLDNFEHLLDAALQVADLLMDAAGLKILVTSRAVLHLSSERVLVVPPLVVPEPGHLPPLEQLMQYEAVRLFVDRAQAVRADFALDAEHASAVTQICQGLEGLPLAIELAAARVALFPPQSLLARLQSPLTFLTGGAHDLPARQQTLRKTIDWSYLLLNPAEQLLFRRLAIFVGSYTLDAIEEICNGDRALPIAMIDGVAALVDHSLVRQAEGPDGEPHFMMLEMIRTYGRERLAEQGEIELQRWRHVTYYLALAQRAEVHLRGPQQAVWLDHLESAHDNLRASLAWFLEEQAELGVQLAGLLWWFWYYQSHFSEGLHWLTQLLEHTETLACTAPRAKACVGAGMLALYRGDLVQAQARCEAGLAMARTIGDSQNAALALSILGTVARSLREYATARQRYDESLALAQAIDDPWLTALALGNLGIMAFHQDNYPRAAAYCTEGLALFRHVGDMWFAAITLNILGRVAHWAGDDQRAAALHQESLTMFRKLGNRWGIVVCLGGLAGVAKAQGQPERAARLLGAEEALREASGEPLFSTISADHERIVATVRAALSGNVFEREWARGRDMLLEHAIVYALHEQE
jgi:predicted ATPase/class 3 adenylate cyclase